MSQKGTNLVLHARKKEHLIPTLKILDPNIKIVQVEAELSDHLAVAAMLETIAKITPQIDIVYNNAAIMTPWREAHTTPVDDYRLSFEINVYSLVKICDYFIPGMKKRGFGRIINITSGIENIPELLPYSMSKAAVDRYVRDLVVSLKDTGVLINLLDPGWLRTDLGGNQAPNAVESVLPGALVPALLENNGPNGCLYKAQEYL
ncbi:MAG: 3-oxoacyl-[acyl-carrier-protein] reductase [Candidatus Magnetoglobus multicellularis str. Araruama]|uniref:3-oxoacyl-[acyl-carrier-protein] reductase n=1 Tax=Candidatus Magnetoglobus multicellularis str. Araruama TaxID=890399 RepID=A0A1V1NZT4_9BACT|nr:MAG: 3-oxoacyl-[acyl-carrier-protein] reductase [Candidatus Magnetoglobus multicellularis str. Araruama]